MPCILLAHSSLSIIVSQTNHFYLQRPLKPIFSSPLFRASSSPFYGKAPWLLPPSLQTAADPTREASLQPRPDPGVAGSCTAVTGRTQPPWGPYCPPVPGASPPAQLLPRDVLCNFSSQKSSDFSEGVFDLMRCLTWSSPELPKFLQGKAYQHSASQLACP